MKDIIKIVVAIMVLIALSYGVDEYRNHKNIAVVVATTLSLLARIITNNYVLHKLRKPIAGTR